MSVCRELGRASLEPDPPRRTVHASCGRWCIEASGIKDPHPAVSFTEFVGSRMGVCFTGHVNDRRDRNHSGNDEKNRLPLRPKELAPRHQKSTTKTPTPTASAPTA